ncbi:MAG: hypothetical protein HY608_03115 [Planctomycetes bacterium]|nr:hypothetical protein [Planctomycetota bacterium]
MAKIKQFLASHGEKIGLGVIVLFLVYSIQASLLTPAGVEVAVLTVDDLAQRIQTALAAQGGAVVPSPSPIQPVLQAFYRDPPGLESLPKPEWLSERVAAVRAQGRLPFPSFADDFLYLKGVISAQVQVQLREGEDWTEASWLRPDLPESFVFADKIEPDGMGTARPDEYFRHEFDAERRRIRFRGLKGNNWSPSSGDPSTAFPKIVLNYFDAADPAKPAGSFLLLIERARVRPRLYPVRNVRSGIPDADRPGEVLVEWEADARTSSTLRVAYRVERREAVGRGAWSEWRAMTDKPITATRYLDATCEPQKRYEYRIQACTPDPCEVPLPR